MSYDDFCEIEFTLFRICYSYWACSFLTFMSSLYFEYPNGLTDLVLIDFRCISISNWKTCTHFSLSTLVGE